MTEQETVMTKEDIKKGLRELGLKRGDIVGVHSSLSSFGYVEGGADAVIDALLEVVGKEGTIAMPTHSNNLERVELSSEEKAAGVSWLFKILPYNPEETPCTTGIIPETFRKRPGVIRSHHPDQSIAAIGPKAKEITSAGDGRSLAGWKVLLELDGYVLLIGVDLGVCTAMHLAESMVQFPKHILEKITPPEWFVEKYPEDEWEWDIGPYPDFAKLEPLCKEHGIMKTVTIGKATVRLLRLRELIDLYAEALRENPDMFYGERAS
jgi:aminoglycoside 3-N-acetyltransferase